MEAAFNPTLMPPDHRPYFPPLHLMESPIDRNFREAATSNWSRTFAAPPSFIKNEFLPTPSPWPPSPPGQEHLFGYLPGNHQQLPPGNRCAGLLTPSPCSSNSDSSDKTYANMLDSYTMAAAAKTFPPFPPQYQYPQPPQIWTPYNFQYPYSNDQHLRLPIPSKQQPLCSETNFLPVTSLSSYTPFSEEEEETNPNPPHSNPQSPAQLSPSAVTETKTSEKTSEEPQRKRRCRCPNCTTGGSGRGTSVKDRRKHLCHIEGCGKVYGKTSHLKAHLRWHNGDRPFRCNFVMCGKSFTRSDELTRHVKTHTGDKRFICQHCDKGFTRSDHLAKHTKIHFKLDNGGGQAQVVKRGRKSNAAKLAELQMKNDKLDFVQIKIEKLGYSQNVEDSREPSAFTTTTITVEDQKIIDEFQSENNEFSNSKQVQFIQENPFYFPPHNFAYHHPQMSPVESNLSQF